MKATEITGKPLFIPLNTEYYEAFASGNKKTEYRRYGPRWNKEVCRVGRRVVISKGYGKNHRMEGTIIGFARIKFNELPKYKQGNLAKLFGDGVNEIACIGIKLDGINDDS